MAYEDTSARPEQLSKRNQDFDAATRTIPATVQNFIFDTAIYYIVEHQQVSVQEVRTNPSLNLNVQEIFVDKMIAHYERIKVRDQLQAQTNEYVPLSLSPVELQRALMARR